jgi:hypothetical protein
MQSLPCLFHLYGIALPMCTQLQKSTFLPLVTIKARPWDVAREFLPCPTTSWMLVLILMYPPASLLAE